MSPYETARDVGATSTICRSTQGSRCRQALRSVSHGIATIVPGERLGARARVMIDYLKTFERSSNLFPGFEAEVGGAYRAAGSARKIRLHTHVVCESARRRPAGPNVLRRFA
jgi:Orn/Lys/Arg decarboxylase, C-terminal domain